MVIEIKSAPRKPEPDEPQLTPMLISFACCRPMQRNLAPPTELLSSSLTPGPTPSAAATPSATASPTSRLC